MSRRVLVTGARGFVGRALVSGFAELGWAVTGVDRDGGVDLAEGVPDDVGEVDVVVHGAWVTTDPATLGVTPAAYMTLNLRPLLAVLEYAARVRPDAFVFLSSSGVFDATDGSEDLADTDVPTGTSQYAVAKRAGELLVAAVLPADAAHVVRLGYVFGPGEVARPSRRVVSALARWVTAAREGWPLEVRADDPRRDWTYAPDLAPALARIVDGPAAGRPLHLGSPHAHRDSEVAALVAELVVEHMRGVGVAAPPRAGTVTVPAPEVGPGDPSYGQAAPTAAVNPLSIFPRPSHPPGDSIVHR